MDQYSDESVRAWAYNPNQNWIDDTNQDEDLAIGLLSPELLLPLVDDPGCPKSDFILQCLDNYHAAIIRSGQNLERARAAMEVAKRFEGEKVRDWAELLDRRLSYLIGAGPVSRDRALAIGWELLLDPFRSGQDDVSVVEENDASYVVERRFPSRFPNPPYWERLTIEKDTGRFSFTQATH